MLIISFFLQVLGLLFYINAIGCKQIAWTWRLRSLETSELLAKPGEDGLKCLFDGGGIQLRLLKRFFLDNYRAASSTISAWLPLDRLEWSGFCSSAICSDFVPQQFALNSVPQSSDRTSVRSLLTRFMLLSCLFTFFSSSTDVSFLCTALSVVLLVDLSESFAKAFTKVLFIAERRQMICFDTLAMTADI